MVNKESYQILPSDPDYEDKDRLSLQSQPHWSRSPIWMFTTLMLTLISLTQLGAYMTLSKNPSGYYQSGFNTDLVGVAEDAIRAISLEELVFTGWIAYNATTRDVYRVTDLSQPQYAGVPSPDIDSAWHSLLKGQYPALTDREAQQFHNGYPVDQLDEQTQSTFDGVWRNDDTGNFHFQLDVFHSLHCLNVLRKAIYRDHYSAVAALEFPPWVNVPPSWPRVHLEHCLDHIRQSIQCNADLSPAPFFVWKGLDITIATAQKHTCRNFDLIKQWQTERNQKLQPMDIEE